MSSSSKTSLWDYLAERFPPGQFAPLALMLLMASLVGGRALHLGELVLQFGLTLSWIFQFRLLDDLHDRERDRKMQPHRVLVQTESLGYFRCLAGLATIGNLGATGLLLSWNISFTILVPLNLMLAALYWKGGIQRLVHTQIVLIKYPMFVLMLSGGIPGFSVTTSLVTLLIYFTFAVFELLHDPSLRFGKRGETALFVEAFFLGVMWFLLAGWTAYSHPIATIILTGLAMCACLLLFHLFRPETTNHRPIFLPTILQLMVLTFLT